MLMSHKLIGVVLAAAVGIQSGVFRQSFPADGLDLRTTGENTYFRLVVGARSTFRDKDTKGGTTLVITVLDETRSVGGINARIVEERESKDGALVEVSRNYFAIDDKSKDVYYLGEDVDMYKNGKVTSHEGSWQHGTRGATFGMMMPGKPAVGQRFYQEQAKGIAMDRAEIVSLTERAPTPAGVFTACVRIKETSPLEPLLRDYKVYAPGIGLVQDGDLKLVSRK